MTTPAEGTPARWAIAEGFLADDTDLSIDADLGDDDQAGGGEENAEVDEDGQEESKGDDAQPGGEPTDAELDHETDEADDEEVADADEDEGDDRDSDEEEPVRTFRWFRGGQFYSGWYWSATTGGTVVYESRRDGPDLDS